MKEQTFQQEDPTLDPKQQFDKVDPKLCKHSGWTFKKHGRICFRCGTFMVDFGD